MDYELRQACSSSGAETAARGDHRRVDRGIECNRRRRSQSASCQKWWQTLRQDLGEDLGDIMPINRVFLNWNRPGLVTAVDYLAERFGSPGELDLANVVMAVPGGRAGRRLLEILVDQAEKRQLE